MSFSSNPVNPPAYTQNLPMMDQGTVIQNNYGSVNLFTGQTQTQYVGAGGPRNVVDPAPNNAVDPDDEKSPEGLVRPGELHQATELVVGGFGFEIDGRGNEYGGIRQADAKEDLSADDKMVTTIQYQDFDKYDYMDVDQEGTIDLIDDTHDGLVEIGGQVWNIARLEALLQAEGSTSNKIKLLNIFDDQAFEQKRLPTEKIAFKHPQLFSGYTIPKLKVIHTRRFYLKIFALDQVGSKNSQFRQWGTKRRDGKRCIAELDRLDHSITFSIIKGRHEKALVAYWFPNMTRSIRRVCYDDRSSSLKIEWQVGKTLYAQFGPSQYRSFCHLLRPQVSKLRHRAADKDLTSWTRSVTRNGLLQRIEK